ncbi:MAG: hypothetical protein O7G85_14175, partial [Planctomycetota bacterium]|nr:hypothetical protein [Planctomycetota bacterium]
MSHTVSASAIYYVDRNDEIEIHDGLAWESAFSTLQDALRIAQFGDEIRVAMGTYRTDEGYGGQFLGNPIASFNIPSGVNLRGGYAGFGQP